MKYFHLFPLLTAVSLLVTFASCGNGSKERKETATDEPILVNEEFDEFLERFRTDEDFQFSRIIFPVGEFRTGCWDEQEERYVPLYIPYTIEYWKFLDREFFRERNDEYEMRTLERRGNDEVIYHVLPGLECPTGFDLSVGFNRLRGKWYLTYAANDEGSDIPTPGSIFEKLRPENRKRQSADRTLPLFGKYAYASQRLLEKADVENLSLNELQLMRNEIYARHHYIFRKGSEMDTYFRSRSWYFPRCHDVSSLLSETERRNIAFLRETEN